MKTGGDVVYGILAGLLLAGIFMFLIAMGAIRFFVYVLTLHRSLLFPFVMIFASLGAFKLWHNISCFCCNFFRCFWFHYGRKRVSSCNYSF